MAVYTDKSSLFQVHRRLRYNKHLEAGRRPTQIERALEELDIERITAHSPQAKGRIERCFGTLQDRLVKELRQAGASRIGEANRYLEQEFLPLWTPPPLGAGGSRRTGAVRTALSMGLAAPSVPESARGGVCAMISQRTDTLELS